MKPKNVIILILIIFLIGGIAFYFFQRSQQSSLNKTNIQNLMQLTSSTFKDNQFIPSKYTCDGENLNPPLEISEVPANAKSLVLIVDDPDAPNGNFTHWLLWNISPSIKEIREGETPQGAVEGLNDFGKNSYGGPCPPSGVHHYHFKLYALDTILELNSSATKEDLEKAIKDHVLDSAELIGLYQR